MIAPIAGSSIPGAPSCHDHGDTLTPGCEEHVPVIFLDLNADDLSTDHEAPVIGQHSILPKELAGKFFSLSIISSEDMAAVASWDSSIHDSVYLNRPTQPNERAYLIVKVVVR